MSKIIEKRTDIVVYEDSKHPYRTVLDFLEQEGIGYRAWGCLSSLVKTTATNNTTTPFNTIREMIRYIPDIINYGEETEILYVFGDSTNYHILGQDYEVDLLLWDNILQKYFPDLKIER